MPRPLSRPAALVAATLLAGLLTAPIAAVPTASADEATDAPVTGADTVTLRGGSSRLVDVLRNDSDPNGDDLRICRLDVPDGVPINNPPDSVALFFSWDDDDARQRLFVLSTDFRPGTYELTYYACDRDYLTPGTLTVTVERTRPVRARKVAPHVVRFVNPDDRRVRVSVSDREVPGPSFGLAPGEARRVRVEGPSLFWYARGPRGGDAGQGLVRGLGRP